MLKLEDIQKNAAVSGIEPGQVVLAGKTIMAGLLIREWLTRVDIDSWIKQQLLRRLEPSREQDGYATHQPNNGERKQCLD